MDQSRFGSSSFLTTVGVVCMLGITTVQGNAEQAGTSLVCGGADTTSQIERQIKDTYERNKVIPITHINLVGERLEVFMAALNRNPPQSRFVADRAVIFVSPTDPHAIVILGQNDCVTRVGKFPVRRTLMWMRGGVDQATDRPLEKKKFVGRVQALK